MTTNNHLIQPSSKLIQQWMTESCYVDLNSAYYYAIDKSAQWGADQELEACCEWLDQGGYTKVSAGALRHVRRREPPNLKEKALDELQRIEANIPQNIKAFEASCDTIRQALEALPNDQQI